MYIKKIELSYGFNDNSADLNKVVEEQNFDQTTSSIIKSLFLFNSYHSSTDSHELIREKRVANTNYFDRYFNLQLSSNDIPEKHFNDFLFSSKESEKLEILNIIKNQGKLFTFLNWSEIKGKLLDKDEISNIIQVSIASLTSLSFKRENFWAWDTDYMTTIRFISAMTGKLDTPKLRQEVLLAKLSSLHEDQYAVFWICDTLLHAVHQFKEDKLNSNHLWYEVFPYGHKLDDSKPFIKKIEKKHKACALNLFNGEIKERNLNEDELTGILDVVSSYEPVMYNEKFPLLLDDDQYLVRLVWMCMKRSYMQSGDCLGYQLAPYQFFTGLEPEKIKDRFEKLDLKSLDEDEKRVVEIFYKAYADGLAEGTYYDFKTLQKMER